MTTPHGTEEQNCPMCDKRIFGRGEQAPYLLIENPWVGASSEFAIHEEKHVYSRVHCLKSENLLWERIYNLLIGL